MGTGWHAISDCALSESPFILSLVYTFFSSYRRYGDSVYGRYVGRLSLLRITGIICTLLTIPYSVMPAAGPGATAHAGRRSARAPHSDKRHFATRSAQKSPSRPLSLAGGAGSNERVQTSSPSGGIAAASKVCRLVLAKAYSKSPARPPSWSQESSVAR